MSYRFGIRSNRCEGWFEAVATPVDGGEQRTSRRFPEYDTAVEAIRYFIAHGRFRREEEEAEAVEEVAVCAACGQPLPEGHDVR